MIGVRQRWLGRARRGVAIFGAVLLSLLTWGVAIEPRLIVDQEVYDVVLPRLPRALDGARIAVIADLQVGMWLDNRDMVRRVVESVIDLRPDVVLIAGDFIYDWSEPDGDSDDADEVAEDLEERRANIGDAASMVSALPGTGLPTLAVLGNHDYGMMWPSSRPLPHVATAVEEALKRTAITVLRNEARMVHIRRGSESYPLTIVGIDTHIPSRDNVAAALAVVPADAPRVAVMHDPASFAQFPPGTAPLAVAGHTHGGQVRLPFLPRWSWMTLVKKEPVHADGWIRGYGAEGNQLYVNRGIGFSTFPIRINCPPEVTLFRLRAN